MHGLCNFISSLRHCVHSNCNTAAPAHQCTTLANNGTFGNASTKPHPSAANCDACSTYLHSYPITSNRYSNTTDG